MTKALQTNCKTRFGGPRMILHAEKNVFFYGILPYWGGPPKHVLHLVWSAYIISTAIRAALKIAEGPKSWEKEGQF